MAIYAVVLPTTGYHTSGKYHTNRCRNRYLLLILVIYNTYLTTDANDTGKSVLIFIIKQDSEVTFSIVEIRS
jgi:hypothetical protein